jgi:hypothetical protein
MSDVNKELKHLAERYASLRDLFGVFHSAGSPALTDIIPGLKIKPLSGDQFDVWLAGTTARFVFTMTDSERIGTRGRVDCYRLNPLKPDDLEPIGHFSFNGQGDTGQKVPNGDMRGDPMLVGTESHSAHLMANLLHKTIAKARPDL